MIIITLPTISSHQRDNAVNTVAPLLRRCCHCDEIVGRGLIYSFVKAGAAGLTAAAAAAATTAEV